METSDLVKKIEKDFSTLNTHDKKLSALTKKVRDGTATYTDAGNYAVRLGNNLSKSYLHNLEADIYDYDTALELLTRGLKSNYRLINAYSKDVQTILNKQYGLDINSLSSDFSMDRVKGLARAISEAETPEEALSFFKEQVINFSQNIVDEAVKKNASFASELGFSPQLIREYEGPHRQHTDHKDGGDMCDCEWCMGLAGTYDYFEVKDSGSDVYKRHEGCRCTVTYIPTKYSRSTMSASGHAFTRF